MQKVRKEVKAFLILSLLPCFKLMVGEIFWRMPMI